MQREASEQPAVVEGDKLIDTHGAYLDSPRNVAKELGVAFVDMNKITHDLVEGMGPVDSKSCSCGYLPIRLPLYLKDVKIIPT